MKILGLISSPSDPASQTRIIQYRHLLNTGHISLTPRYYKPLREADPPSWIRSIAGITRKGEWGIWDGLKTLSRLPLLLQQLNYDLIWQNRLVLSGHFYFERKWQRPFVFDIDDAIWLTEGREMVEAAMKRSAVVFAGNEELADFSGKFQQNVCIVPTTVDTERLKPANKSRDGFTLGWIGTPGNFPYLELIKDAVTEFLSKHTDARLEVVSSTPPQFFSFDNERIVFRHWSLESENDLINEFDVGLMPLPDNEWTRGKCSYKMLQYLACGIPAIVSPVGNNRKILGELGLTIGPLDKESWVAAFQTFKSDVLLYKEFSIRGRRLVEEKYAAGVWAGRIAEHFKKIV